MTGRNLYNAAQMISKAGTQIDTIIEATIEKLAEELREKEYIREYLESSERKDTPGDWLLAEYQTNMWLIRPWKRKAYSHIAIHIVLSDEYLPDLKIEEPILFVMFAPGTEPFDFDSLSSILKECVEEEKLIQWAEEGDEFDAWMFAVPIVKLNSESDLAQQVVQPAVNLILNSEARAAFPQNSIACSFQREDEGVFCRAKA